ncbi:MAG: hypothetical protein Q8L53_05610 [Aestuariivirga sp.]|nr:hypothetical protein [Aestuariivirga sp.]
MGLLVAVIALFVIIYFAVVSSGFRIFLLVALAAALPLGYFWYQQSAKESADNELRLSIARSLVKPTDLEMADSKLTPPSYPGLSLWNIYGVIKNNSDYEIESIALTIEVTNCDAYDSNCVVVGSGIARRDILRIPKGQARAFNVNFPLENLPKLDKWKWRITDWLIEARNPE